MDNSQYGYKVYNAGNENFYASRLNYEDTLTFISEIEDISIDELYIEECNIDKYGMYFPIGRAKDIDKLNIYIDSFCNYQIFEDYLEKWITYREALKRIKENPQEWDCGDIFMISTSNR